MSTLEELIEWARHRTSTPEELEERARSFAFGNVHLHNPRITRADIDAAADQIRSGK